MKLSEIKANPKNPRLIKDAAFKELVQSLKDLPEMAEVRPIVVNKGHMILGGNMRYRAMLEAGWKEAPVVVVDWPKAKQEQFIIKDNLQKGEWDWEILANEWDPNLLKEWGLYLPPLEDEDFYSRSITTPTYEPSTEKPDLGVLVDEVKVDELLKKILNSKLPDDEKKFLTIAAYRHYIFDYSKIADYYASGSKELQDLIEQSALVIIDFKKAIELGYVELTKDINEIEALDYGS